MPYIYNNSIKYINDQNGNPTLTVQGITDTCDGYTNMTSANYRPIQFTPTESYTTADGYTDKTASDYRPITQQP